MAGLAPWVFVVVLLRGACDAAVSNAHEETCLDSKANKQLVQARMSLDLIADKEEDLAATKIVRRDKCPWLINEGKGCHQDDTKPLCEDGNYSWTCRADGHGERLLCPCTWPRMCSHKTCRGGEYCCEPTCINHGGMRPCEGEEEPEPINEPDRADSRTDASPTHPHDRFFFMHHQTLRLPATGAPQCENSWVFAKTKGTKPVCPLATVLIIMAKKSAGSGV